MAKIKIEKPNKLKTSPVKQETIKKKAKKDKIEPKNVKLLLKDGLSSQKSVKSELQINLDQVKIAIEGLFKVTKETGSKKLLDDVCPIFLQVTVIKIPDCSDRIVRLPLKKSLLTDTSEVCLIVPDIRKGRRVDYNPTIEHYEDILRKNEISCINKIIPMNCIKTEYDQFELKRRLVGQFDIFLADGRICGHLTHKLGKIFSIKRKLPTPVKMDTSDLKNCFDRALKKTQMHIHSKGNSYMIQIGHLKMSVDDITANFDSVSEELIKVIPGGKDNIRALYVKTNVSVAIPIYMSLKNANDIKTPIVKSKKAKLSKAVVGELSTINDADVTVLPAGDVIVPLFEKINKAKMINKKKTRKAK